MNSITDTQLTAYREGRLDAESDAAMEELMMTDPRLRARLAELAPAPRLTNVWFDVQNQLDQPQPSRLERFALRLGTPEPATRLAGAMPTLTRSWIIGLGVLMVVSMIVSGETTRNVGTDRFVGYLILAPLIVIVAVAAAYRRSGDPAHEITVAAPISGARLVLWRVLAVAPTAAAVNLVAGLLIGARWFALAWILPGLACTFATLALATTFSMRRSAIVVGTVWVTLISITALASSDNVIAFRAGGQLLALLVAGAAAGVFFIRRGRLEEAVRW